MSTGTSPRPPVGEQSAGRGDDDRVAELSAPLARPAPDGAAVTFANPSPQWTAAEWDAYRLQLENADLRDQLEHLRGPNAVRRHALNWALIMSTVGVLFVLAIVLPTPLATVCWALFAADVLGLAAYGYVMEEHRSREKKA
jgi:hypothetical protein